MAYDVFVSYASEDLARVLPIVRVLQRHGWRVWIDKRMLAGTQFHDAIGDHLQNAKTVLVAWSKHSVKSIWVKSEATAALEAETLVPLRLEDIRLPHPFGLVQSIDHFTGVEPTGSTLKLLIKSIEAKAGRPVVRPSKPGAQAQQAAPPQHAVPAQLVAAEPVERQVPSTLVEEPAAAGHAFSEDLAPTSAPAKKRSKRVALAAVGGLIACSLLWMLRTSWAREPDSNLAVRPSLASAKAPRPLSFYTEPLTGLRYPLGWEVTDDEPGVNKWATRVREPRSTVLFQLIPPGSFPMGSPSSELGRSRHETQHQVTLTRPFYMSATEVTWAQVAALAQHAGREEDALGWTPSDVPIDVATWAQAIDFCNDLGGTLPSEAQWEYAARAGTTTTWWWGNSVLEGRGKANIAFAPGNNRTQLTSAGQFAPNGFGLYDMIGNTWEWCRDVYTNAYGNGVRVDPVVSFGGEERVVRGGSFESAPHETRSAHRRSVDPDLRSESEMPIGFRVVIELP